ASSAMVHPVSSSSDADNLSSQGDSPYRDGTYYASGEGKFGELPVVVIIKDGVITRISLGANEESVVMVERVRSELVEQIIETQSTDVDVIAGATVTSEALISAVNEALARASK
ncbi:MAG: FMN-binding protein, partial [Coriobacteriia bacterium]|nr:FMN-binding protein [Coriobacteriia bacterium]